MHWLPVVALGVSYWSLRFGCAVIGTVSIFVLYRWARRWWGNAVALCAALALSLNIEHVYWSRIALNNIDAALLGACALAALAWALDTRCWRAWVSLGYALGFGFYTFHGANLHPVLAAVVLLVLAVGRVERFSWPDLYGGLVVALAAGLAVAPLVPTIITHWNQWYGYQAGRFDLSGLFGPLWRGDIGAARMYVGWHFEETAQLFRPAPVMRDLVLCGSAITLWHWKDTRYLTAMLWMGGILLVGSATIGWRSARMIGAMPVVSLMAGLAVLLRWQPSAFGRLAVGCGFVLPAVVLYEGWWVEFVWSAQFRNAKFGLCRALQRVPLPATIYVAGKGEPSPEEALLSCTTPDDPRRHFITIPPQTSTAPEIRGDPNVVAIVFPDRIDLLLATRQRYPDAVQEPHLVNGAAAFYVVRLRSSCPATPLLQTYNPR